MIELIILKSFFDTILLPSIAGAFVFALILNSLLKHWGYKLW